MLLSVGVTVVVLRFVPFLAVLIVPLVAVRAVAGGAGGDGSQYDHFSSLIMKKSVISSVSAGPVAVC